MNFAYSFWNVPKNMIEPKLISIGCGKDYINSIKDLSNSNEKPDFIG